MLSHPQGTACSLLLRSCGQLTTVVKCRSKQEVLRIVLAHVCFIHEPHLWTVSSLLFLSIVTLPHESSHKEVSLPVSSWVMPSPGGGPKQRSC